jgi:NADH-quinone oxidoreductase subunit H
MDGYFFLFTGLKILIALLFVINTAALLTWGERRHMAMIQDRVGPNRAVIYLPALPIKGLLLLLGLGLAGGVGAFAFVASKRSPAVQLQVGFELTELAILLSWVALVIWRGRARKAGATSGPSGMLANIADARIFFYFGLAAHVGTALWFATSGENPPALLVSLFRVGTVVAPVLLAVAGVAGMLAVPAGKVGLRLAGTLHALADGLKMAFKEDFIPPNGDRLLHSFAPLIALFPAFVVFAVVPFGDTLCLHIEQTGHFWADLFNGRIGSVTDRGYSPIVPSSGVCVEGAIPLQVANLNVGILYMFAIAGTGIVGAAIAGWSSDNKFSLLGGLRAASQMVSYEVALGLSLVGALMIYGSVRLDDMVRWQSDNAWGIFVQPVAFFLFLASSIAENKRTPFDAPEGESEIVAGYFVEYSGMKFGMFMLGEYMELAISSAVLVTIFFGGYSLPFVHRDGITIAFGDTVYYHTNIAHAAVIGIGVAAFFIKSWIVCWTQIFIRWTILRFRYDQIMKLGWRYLLPAALGNIVLTALGLLLIREAGPAVANGIDWLADLSHALVALLGIAGLIALISGFLAPKRVSHRDVSSSATFAEAQGGTKSAPMGA